MMITYSIILKSQLEGAHRLDAEYYQPEYLEWMNQLTGFKPQSLDSVTEKIDVGFVSSMKQKFKDSGVPLLRTQNVKEFYPDLESDLVYIDPAFHEKLKKSQVYPGYVLLARSGSIGDACVVSENLGIANSADIILIKPKGKILPEYLAAFLNCRYGRFQIDRSSSGGLQGHMNLYSLEKLLIPVIDNNSQKEIKKIVTDGLSKLQESKSLYSQAENLLLEELELKDFKIADDLFYTVNLSCIISSHRADAEYFQPKYEKLESKIKKRGAKRLEEIIKNVPAKFNPTVYPQQNFKYVELANINPSIGVIDEFSKVLGKEAPGRAKRVLKAGDVILSSVEGSLGKVALVDKEQEGYLASTGFFQFRSKDILPEALLILAKSLVFHMQLEKQCAGTILTAVPKESIKNIFVPILPKPLQQKIADLVRQSHEACKKARFLLEEAKKKVEEMIEESHFS